MMYGEEDTEIYLISKLFILYGNLLSGSSKIILVFVSQHASLLENFFVCVQVNEDRTVKVMFVDYGNAEKCKASEMRKNVYMSDFPIQCHKCQLEGIKPVSRNTYSLIY